MLVLFLFFYFIQLFSSCLCDIAPVFSSAQPAEFDEHRFDGKLCNNLILPAHKESVLQRTWCEQYFFYCS